MAKTFPKHTKCMADGGVIRDEPRERKPRKVNERPEGEGASMLSRLFGGMTGGAVSAIEERKRKNKEALDGS